VKVCQCTGKASEDADRLAAAVGVVSWPPGEAAGKANRARVNIRPSRRHRKDDNQCAKLLQVPQDMAGNVRADCKHTSAFGTELCGMLTCGMYKEGDQAELHRKLSTLLNQACSTNVMNR
jgi:hypothetical protein